MFFWNSLAFSMIQHMFAIWPGSSAFSKTSLNMWKFMVHILLKPGLENFEHKRRLVLGVHWRDWCWSWNSNTLATWCQELTHWKRPWCWERLRAGGEGDDRGWDGWMASPTQWTWVWVNSGSWWWTGRPDVLWFMGLQRVGHDWATELNWHISTIKMNTALISQSFHVSLSNPSLMLFPEIPLLSDYKLICTFYIAKHKWGLP